MTEEKEELYLLYNVRDKCIGWYDHCMVFWCPNSAGYCNTVDGAGRYTREEALAKTKGSHGEVQMVAESKVLKASRTITCCWIDALKPRTRKTKTLRRIEAGIGPKAKERAA